MKYYAVRNGRVPGIYADWNACKAQTEGFPNARFKSFKTEDEARSYLNGHTEEPFVPEAPYAFVDGSYNPDTGVIGYGGFLVLEDGTTIAIQGHRESGPDSMRNVSGEIAGAMHAVQKAVSLGLKSLTVYYDYQGIQAWADGTWKANKPQTASYAYWARTIRGKIDLTFVKVAAHTGIPGNEEADRLAKQAAGIC